MKTDRESKIAGLLLMNFDQGMTNYEVREPTWNRFAQFRIEMKIDRESKIAGLLLMNYEQGMTNRDSKFANPESQIPHSSFLVQYSTSSLLTPGRP